MDRVAATFSHFTYAASKGKLMIVDIQGWDVDGKVIFTDPQIHTRSFKGTSAHRNGDALFRRYSVANFGKSGMCRFLLSHECTDTCRNCGLKPPFAPLTEAEIEFEIPAEITVRDTHKIGQTAESSPVKIGRHSFALRVFPSGETKNVIGPVISAYIKACPTHDTEWEIYHGIEYDITLVHWGNPSKSVTNTSAKNKIFIKKQPTWGWNNFFGSEPTPQLCKGGWLSSSGTFLVRASVKVPEVPDDDTLTCCLSKADEDP